MYSNIFGVEIDALLASDYGLAVVLVTPEMANFVANKDDENFRSLDRNRVSAYARAMKRGDWSPALSILAFLEDGTMIDGQHRLKAVSESGQSCVFVIRVTPNPDDVAKVDVGKPRTANQVLAHQYKEFKNSSDWASMFQSIVRYRRASRYTDVSEVIANAEWIEVVETEWTNNPYVESLSSLVRERRRAGLVKVPRPQMMFMWYLMAEVSDADTADEFWNGVRDYALLDSRDPRRFFGEFLAELKDTTFTGQRGQQSIRRMIAYAWNSWRSGKSWYRIPDKFNSSKIVSDYNDPLI